MRSWSKQLIASILLCIIAFFGISLVSQTTFAHDEEHEHYYDRGDYYGEHRHGHKDGPLEESGVLLGWGTAIAMGGAVLLMPLRRNSSKLMKALPESKSVIKAVVKFFSKSHIWIGVIAILFSGVHGILMFIDEGKFDFDIILGIISFALMVIAALFGISLARNKGLKTVRSAHFGLLFVAIFISIVHIFVA